MTKIFHNYIYLTQQPPQQAKHSLFRGSPLALPKLQYAESSLSGSMASLASGVIVPSLVNGMMRHSLNNMGVQRPDSRLSQNRRSSARQLTMQVCVMSVTHL